MRYEEYRKKMVRTKRAIIGGSISFVVLLAAGIAIESIISVEREKIGNIDYVTDIEISYKYGEGIKIEGSAYRSDVVFEYSEIDKEEWTEKVPTIVGEYKVRGRSAGSDGPKYSRVQTFEITPIEVAASIIEDRVDYGKDPHVTMKGLVLGDVLKDDYTTTFSTLVEKEAEVTINENSLHLFNKAGEEVTSCYKITTEKKNITFNPQRLNLRFDDVEKYYDGTSLRNDNYEITSGSLYYGDYIEVTGGGSIIDIGTHTNEHVAKVYDKDGVENKNYTVSIVDNTLEIYAIPLTISSRSKSKTYDGYPFEDSVFEIQYDQNKLLPGHTIKYSNIIDKTMSYPFSDQYNEFNYSIEDEDGNDVSNFYEVSKQVGKLSIYNRGIKIKSNTFNTTFDNQEHFDAGYEIIEGSIADTDELRVISYDTFGPDVGNGYNVLGFSIINKSTNEDITNYYIINQTYGTWEITKDTISISLLSGNAYPYDGEYHDIYDLNSYTVTGLKDTYSLKMTINDISKNKIRDYNKNGYSLSKTDFTVTIRSKDDSRDITSNFNINYNFGSASIQKIDATITTGDIERGYNGQSIATDINNIGYTATGLVQGEYGDYIYREIDSSMNSVINHGTGDIICSYKIYSNYDGREVTNNYNLTIKNGTYNINQIPLNISFNLLSKEYDATTKINANQIGIKIDSETPLASTDTLVIQSNASINTPSSDVGNYSIAIDPSIIQIKRGTTNSKDNYIINITNNLEFEIFKRSVEIYQIRSKVYYDGLEHGIMNESDFQVNNLVDGHKISFTGLEPAIEKGIYEYVGEFDQYGNPTFVNEFTTIIKDEKGNDVTHNYELVYFFDEEEITIPKYSFEIVKKSLFIETIDTSKAYDGTPLNPSLAANMKTIYYDYHFTDGETFTSGHKLQLTATGGRPTDVADSNDPEKNQFQFTYKIIDSKGADVTNAYIVETKFAELSIYKCNLTVNTKKAKTTYGKLANLAQGSKFDVTMNTGDEYGVYVTPDSNKIPSNHHIQCISTATTTHDTTSGIVTIGDYNLTCVINLYKRENNVDVDYDPNNINFVVKRTAVEITITIKDAKIVTDSAEKAYNPRRPVPAPESRTVTGITNGDTMYFGKEQYAKSKTYYDSVKDKIDKGTYTNEVGPYVVKHGSVDVTYCYNFTIVEGTIIIT